MVTLKDGSGRPCPKRKTTVERSSHEQDSCPDLPPAIPSLNRFCCSCPRSSRHLDMAILVIGYIKQVSAVPCCIPIKSRPFLVINRLFDKNSTEKYKPDFLMDWPDAKEELDLHWYPKSSSGTANELPITTIFIDSDDAPDSKTCHSTTSLIAFVGSTFANGFPKRQGAIASSTYQAEFSVLRSATEEAIHLCYMLRSMVNPHAINIKKPGVAISFHTVREYGVHLRWIHECYWINGGSNTADIRTKQTPAKITNDHSAFQFLQRKHFFS